MAAYPMDMSHGKDVTATVIKSIADHLEAVAVMYVTEAWTSEPTADEIEKIHHGEMSISESSNRVEALVGSLETRVGTKMFSVEIDRSSGTKKLVNERVNDMTPMSGRFSSFLKESPTLLQ